ncbi:hypothetical protein [Rhodococcus opacus]|nr:hypothetical protein [Rhodococcus opacus]
MTNASIIEGGITGPAAAHELGSEFRVAGNGAPEGSVRATVEQL